MNRSGPPRKMHAITRLLTESFDIVIFIVFFSRNPDI